MTRVPDVDPERDWLIAYYIGKLEHFRRIPAARRADECANEGEETCRAMLAELQAPGFERSPSSHTTEIMTLDEFLDQSQIT